MEAVKRILIADMSEEFCRGLTDVMEREPDLQAVGRTGDGAELVRMVRELEPDAVVMETVLTGLDGLDVLEELARLPRRPRILVLSSYTRSGLVEEAAAKGADYFMPKPCRASKVCERLR